MTVTIKNATRGFDRVYQTWIDGQFCQTFETVNGLLSFLNILGANENWETDYEATKLIEA